MRAFSEGYYPSLKAMYDFLKVGYQRQRMLFSFCAGQAQCSPKTESPASRSLSSPSTYFVHASNNHIFPPLRPQRMSMYSYLIELVFVGVCHAWFSVCCQLIDTADNEPLSGYLRRIHLPQFFITFYLLPLLSAICTCSHDELLHFPARDLVEYRKQILGGEQFVVAKGVSEVQKILLAGLNVTYNASVELIEPRGTRSTLHWKQPCNKSEPELHTKQFDEIILAVPPNIVAQIFKPASQLSRVPTRLVKTITHSDMARLGHRSLGPSVDTIYLRTFFEQRTVTEATHYHCTGLQITTLPQTSIDPSSVRAEHTFTRVLRTVESRKTVNDLLALQPRHQVSAEKWSNGQLGVWVVGAWCWDGMVLLEGCVVSAARVARALHVKVPWC